MSVHRTVNVWDRRRGIWRFWCLDCGKEGVLRATEPEATSDGKNHAKKVQPL